MKSFQLLICFLAVLILQASSTNPPPALWDPYFTAPIHQSVTTNNVTYTSNFTLYYDSTSKPYGQSLYVHSKGQVDGMCTSIVGKTNSDEPCNVLTSKDGWRYVMFPNDNSCCKFCNISSCAGIIEPDWLNGASYVGQKEINGELCEGWMKQGHQQNYYFVTVAHPQKPCQYYEGQPTLAQGNNTWTFITNEYEFSMPNPNIFDVPEGCNTMCQQVSSVQKLLKKFKK